MTFIKITSISLGLILFSGCSIKQDIQTVSPLVKKEICIIENPAVIQEGFLVAYTEALNNKGYKTKILAPNSPLNTCNITSTYTGNWTWDVAVYLSFAEMKVYKDEILIGKALYDSRSGSANMNKFVDAETKIKELTNQLFP